MAFAMNVGLIQQNPLLGIKDAFLMPKTMNMPTLNPSELPAFMKNLNQASIKFETRCLIEFQLHTMVRPSEASGRVLG